jgi:uncharacterized protein
MRTNVMYLASFVVLAACGQSGPSAGDLNTGGTGGAGAVSGTSSGAGTGATVNGGSAGTATGGTGLTPTGGTGGAMPTGGTGATDVGGSAGSAPLGGTSGSGVTGGSGGSEPTGGSAGSGVTGGSGGDGGTGGAPPTGPYAPRSGSFKMLVYSRTTGFRHGDSINTGKSMLQQIATEQGFQVTFTETNNEINAAGLAQYEIVFFMNSTGTIFSATEKQAYEDWMRTSGAFAGVHSATDTENGWAFYSEVTGQYYDIHDDCCTTANIVWDAAALNHVSVRGLPNPWSRSEEWYRFNRAGEWSAKPGFQILSRVTTNTVGGTRPVSYTREWGNFRAWYTSLGHQAAVFQDANVKKHVAAGIMWAVRREHLIQ